MEALTNDQSWELLREFCNAVNGRDFAKVQELTEAHLPVMQECHFEALLEGVALTDEAVEQHRPFLTRVVAHLDNTKMAFRSLRTGIRAGLLEVMINGESEAP